MQLPWAKVHRDQQFISRLILWKLNAVHISLLAGLLAVSTLEQLFAQDIEVSVGQSEPPYYVGQAAIIQFNVEGFDEQPQPTVSIDTNSGKLADGLRGRLGQVIPQVMARAVFRDGQIFQSRQVTHQIQYLVTADKAGEYSVGPFIIQQGAKQVKVKSRQFAFESVPNDPDLRVRLILPEQPIYVDQRVPVKIEWWYAGETDSLEERNVYSPLFDMFRFATDEQPRRGSNVMPIETKDGTINLEGTAREVRQDGKNFVVLAASRVMIPDKVGEFPEVSISATIRKVTQWDRRRSRSPFDLFEGSLFDQRRPAKVEMGQAMDTPKTIVVKPFPAEGRPASFSGGVGNGFVVEVAADRTVVRVGDPIALNITLKGDGNVDNAKLPNLSADGGLNPNQFRLPQGEMAGEYSEGTKKFRVSVRVADESVSEIPAIAYSWFDPTTESYQTTFSKPIALRVMPSKVIGAGDVVSKQIPPNESAGSRNMNGAETENSGVKPAMNRPSSFTLSGADLAIEPNADLLLASRTLSKQDWINWTIYVGSCLLVFMALVDRRMRQRDPALVAASKCIRQQAARVAKAAGLPRRQAAEEIAAALRQLISVLPHAPRDEAQQVVAACEAIIFSPTNAADQPLDEALVRRAKQVVEACAK